MRNRCLLLLAAFAFLAFSVRFHAQERSASLIETVAGAKTSGAGGESLAVAGREFSFGAVSGLATDATGNTYFSLAPLSQVFRLSPDGRVAAYAGNGVRGQPQEDVLATTSPLSGPTALAVDATGNLFIVSWEHLSRMDAATGVLTTVLKMPYRRPGSEDSILSINGMSVGPDGVLYISDGSDGRIKSYSLASGAITILAGNGERGPTKPGQAATATPLKNPQAVAVASDGTVYFTTLEPAVFRIHPGDGRLEVVKIGLKKELPVSDVDIPSDIVLDSSGHLLAAQANRSRVLRMDLKSGKVAVFAGTGVQHFNGDGISAVKATTTLPRRIALDPARNLLIAEDSRIRRVDASTNLIATVVGNGLPASSAATTPAVEARLWEPAYAVPAADGSLYITSSFSQRLLRVDPQGDLTIAAGGGDPRFGGQPGPALQVALAYPQGIWPGDDGNVYFSDRDNRVVRRLSVQKGSVTNFATTPKQTNAAGMFLDHAAALVADANHFYLSDPNGHRVWRISRHGGHVEPYAGTGDVRSETPGGEGGDAKSAVLFNPSGLALDSSGNLFIADGNAGRKQGRIFRVDAGGRIVTVLSNLQQPSGLAFESPGVLCFSEAGGNQVRCLDLATGSLRVIAGTGEAGSGGDGGPAECAQLNRPSGISFDRTGNLYIADTGNQRIRRVRVGNGQIQCRDR